jgi:type IV pilus assembly protein PilM
VQILGEPATVGVDLGRRTVKIVAVRHRSRPQLVSAAIQAIPEGAIEGGVILNPAAVIDALRAARRSARIRGGRGVIGMGGRNVIVRHFAFPPMPPEELRNAVRWEAERQLPVRMEDTVMDAQPLGDVTEDGQRRLEVLMAAAPERDALLHFRVATEGGLDVAAIEVTSLALARLLGDTETPTAAVDIGSDVTEIVISHKTLPLVCRSLPVGRDHLSWDNDSGTAAPGDGDAAPPAPGGPAAASASGFRELLEGLTRSLDYFQAQARRGTVERVVLTGEGALLPGVAQVLAAELAVPVEVGDPLALFKLPPDLPQDIQEHGPTLAIAAGLALRALS